MGFLENTPLGCRIVFGLCAGYYLLSILEPHLFLELHAVCRPRDVIYGWQIHRLLQASFAHSSILGLLLAALVSWRRFAGLENRAGTMAFLVWFVVTSFILHSAYCLLAILSLPFLGDWLMNSEVHGLYPVLVANLVTSIKETDNGSVWLWPLPFHVSTRSFPLVVMTLSWLLHMDSHLDVSVAYFAAVAAPDLFEEPNNSFLDRVEQALGKSFLGLLQAFDCFVCRPPTGEVSGLGFKPKEAPDLENPPIPPADEASKMTAQTVLGASPEAHCYSMTDDEDHGDDDKGLSEYDDSWL